MGWNEFRRMPLNEQLRLLKEARGQKEEEKIKKKDRGIFRLPKKLLSGEYERLEEKQLDGLTKMLCAGGEDAKKVIQWIMKNATCLNHEDIGLLLECTLQQADQETAINTVLDISKVHALYKEDWVWRVVASYATPKVQEQAVLGLSQLKQRKKRNAALEIFEAESEYPEIQNMASFILGKRGDAYNYEEWY
ncbi:MAG: hypothetical protein N3E51_02110 [Candidatus Micrarchaeota archaeon]|nr:hypothetical protein [Candidatus Micrarchaeota archaeon]